LAAPGNIKERSPALKGSQDVDEDCRVKHRNGGKAGQLTGDCRVAMIVAVTSERFAEANTLIVDVASGWA
jgi:hypothetical protein